MYICVYICIYGTRMEQEWHMNGTRITLFTQIIHPYLSQESPHELTSNELYVEKLLYTAFHVECRIYFQMQNYLT